MILTPSEITALEQGAFQRGVAAADLMNQAGEGIAEVVRRFFQKPETCVVYVGKGHNAGDALVAARFLAERGWKIVVRLAFPPEKMAPLSQSHLQTLIADYQVSCVDSVLEKLPGPLVLLDGLLGIGSKGAPRGVLEIFIKEINHLRSSRGAFVVAVDLPSGLDAVTGGCANACVEADWTITIAAAKSGLLADQATNKVGRLAVVPLSEWSIAEEKETSIVITSSLLRPLLPPRAFDVHKGNFGHVGIVAGSFGYLGAARLAATAALHAGAGLVTLYTLPKTYDLLAPALPPEIMLRRVKRWSEVLVEPLDALAIGPGLGKKQREEVLELAEKTTLPCLLDADALNAIATRKEILSAFQGPRLLTPHPGEMERLFPAAKRERSAWATDFVNICSVTLILKGSRSIVAEKGKPLAYNTTGNPGMASGGMGDALSGVAATFLATGRKPYEAAMLAVWLCGRAAELAVFEQGASSESLVASDVIASLGKAIASLRAGDF